MSESLGCVSPSPGKVRSYLRWAPAEEAELRKAVEKYGRTKWEFLSDSPEFPLLCCRSATMLKNKFYKMLRAKQVPSSCGEKKGGKAKDPPPVGRANSSLSSLDRCASIDMTDCVTPPQTPQQKKVKHTIQIADRSTPAHPPASVGVTPARTKPTQGATNAKLDDALAMMKEALAIQIDANKAVAMCIEARDNGQGDDDTVRTALHVASLAHEKARKARQIVTLARQEHATQMLRADTMLHDDIMDVGAFEMPTLNEKHEMQAGTSTDMQVSEEVSAFSKGREPAPHESEFRSVCFDPALMEACNFIVDNDWSQFPECPLDRQTCELPMATGLGNLVACCKHHADMFGLCQPEEELASPSVWDLGQDHSAEYAAVDVQQHQ